MKKFIYGSLTLASLMVSSLSYAAVDKPWAGLFFGANVGFGWSGQSITESGNNAFGANSVANAIRANAIPHTIAGSPSGAIGGFSANYNYEFNAPLVLGVAADYDWSNIYSAQTAQTNIAPFSPFIKTAQQNLQSLGTVRLLLGYTARTLPALVYVTGGFGYGNVSMSGAVSNPGCVSYCGKATTSGMNSGWVTGAGLSYALSSNWSMKIEYLYYNLGTQVMRITDKAFPGSYIGHSVDYKGNVIRFGADYKFM